MHHLIDERYKAMLPADQLAFAHKLLIAAQYTHFAECEEIIAQATSAGLYEQVVPTLNESHPEISDLDNPIERIVFNEHATKQDEESKQ